MVPPRVSQRFLLSLVLFLRCLKVRLEVCPGFLVTLIVVPLVTFIVEQARVVHKRVNRVDNIFVGDRQPSVVRKLLGLLDPLHQFLERYIRVPRLRQLRVISNEVLVFYLPVLSGPILAT